MPEWYLKERQREVAALQAFHAAVTQRSSRDENPYIRALAIANRPKDVDTE
jgi:hypothetical protein